ncbi:hypothetical protein EV643_103244 [Kribbella sp. VKM Ac-2527]|uniref:GIY-YIG domain-containing protein n=1 Tax=Kribbella caucasensis TaxID=2512215 RepID=A0A4R6KM88_9ACTN|nr:hypothetical protein [Kribbella sp. VKM Ac-2527]TDO51505.1 hypothetical protein EV643_103244 [Kribbella sp. VKM Ac-2527]
MTTGRQADLDRFYRLLAQLVEASRGLRRLRECTVTSCPSHGVYFFFEPGENRINGSSRVVRVGTHALTATSQTTLWTRLKQHRGHVGGVRPGGGNHRGSIFRHHVGTALLATEDWPSSLHISWRSRHVDHSARTAEYPLEKAVSDYIAAMPMLWCAVTDRGVRSAVERNSIALLSCRTGGHDLPSAAWLGRHADSQKLRTSGLWNVNHVDEPYDRSYLDVLEGLVESTG